MLALAATADGVHEHYLLFRCMLETKYRPVWVDALEGLCRKHELFLPPDLQALYVERLQWELEELAEQQGEIYQGQENDIQAMQEFVLQGLARDWGGKLSGPLPERLAHYSSFC